jgi:hypothetical protein
MTSLLRSAASALRRGTTRPTATRSAKPAAARRTATVVGVGLSIAALGLAGCGAQAQSQQDLSPTDLPAITFTNAGTTQDYTVPPGVTSIFLTAAGAGGGKSRQAMAAPASTGALITGNIAVTPGQILEISVGQAGADASDHNSDPKGGWGGLGANGGTGNAASDTLRTGGAGGGATVVQLANADGSNAQTILVAGGGGGEGGRSGDLTPAPFGGSAGCANGAPSWTGSNGHDGSSVLGGKGGAAAAESTMAGVRSKGGSGLGGNGGGGGGGVKGGAPGTSASGTSAAGGGGAGSSTVDQMTQTTITCNSAGGNGLVVVAPSA